MEAKIWPNLEVEDWLVGGAKDWKCGEPLKKVEGEWSALSPTGRTNEAPTLHWNGRPGLAFG